MDQATTLRHIVNQGREDEAAKPTNPRATRVIAVTSGKGGVGKTNIVLNLCVALSRMKNRVFLMDADMGLANVDVLLGLSPEYTVEHVMSGQKRMAEIMLTGPGGFKILPSASGISELSEMSYEQQMRLFQELGRLEGQIDYLFIDTGAGISSNVLRFNASANEIVVVSSPEPTAITDAYALMKLLSIKYHVRDFYLVANNVASEADGQTVYDRLYQVCSQYLQVNLTYLGAIPFDRAVRRAVRMQKPLLESFPTSPASRGVLQIASRLHHRPRAAVPAPEAPPSTAAVQPQLSPSGFWDRLLHWRRVK